MMYVIHATTPHSVKILIEGVYQWRKKHQVISLYAGSGLPINALVVQKSERRLWPLSIKKRLKTLHRL